MVDTHVFCFHFENITAADGSAPKTPRDAAALWLFEFVDVVAQDLGCNIRSYRVITLGACEAIVSITFTKPVTERQAGDLVEALLDCGLSGAAQILKAQRFTVDVYALEHVGWGTIQHALAGTVAHVEFVAKP